MKHNRATDIFNAQVSRAILHGASLNYKDVEGSLWKSHNKTCEIVKDSNFYVVKFSTIFTLCSWTNI